MGEEYKKDLKERLTPLQYHVTQVCISHVYVFIYLSMHILCCRRQGPSDRSQENTTNFTNKEPTFVSCVSRNCLVQKQSSTLVAVGQHSTMFSKKAE